MSGGDDRRLVLVVGIGASAGGVEALKEFFSAMPADSGMAFVVIQHLEPTHESRMAEILGKCTPMSVVQAENGMPVRANHVYANPPGKYLSISEGQLVLSEQPDRDRIRMPIDCFLASLAEDQHEASACVILSGSSGSDGTRGVRAVHGVGGLCLTQDPITAQFPEMPQSAIDTGLVDHILPAARLPAALLGFAKHELEVTLDAGDTAAQPMADDLESILTLLRVRTNSDYRHYKKATVVRRINRRIGIKQAAGVADYLRLLREDDGELTQLSRDMLIGVTSFFRDPDAFDELHTSVVTPMVAGRDPDSPLRAWAPGCATGEEAYSIAMLLLEAVDATDEKCPIQVFASDIDERALEVGRAGVYAESIAEAISPDRLKRFFTQAGEKYRVNKRLREAVVFSRQDLISDPPFSRLDLVSCRNLLIYIEPAVQRKILSLFGFALNPGGVLFLGKSEGITAAEDLFEPVSKQWQIHRLIRPSRQALTAFPLTSGRRRVGVLEPRAVPPPTAALIQTNQAVLLKHFRASVVLIDSRGQILHFYGETERYLGHPKGAASLNVLDMTTGMLSVKLRRAMERALRFDEPITIRNATVPRAGTQLANLTVMRVPSQPDADQLLAVIFEDTGEAESPTPTAPTSATDVALVAQLEEEVKSLRNELRDDTEGFESATEELTAANEEVMSMNEELQSTNEELEASKEELQSLNEELTTVNSQLDDRVAELTATNNDLANLLAATEIATVFLDSQLRIKRFTPRATELLNLIPADLGRPVSDITQNFDGKELAAESEKTLGSLSPTEKEVQTSDGRWHTMRVLPYRTLDDRIDGVVITFSDVTRLKHIEEERRELERRVQHAQKLESLGVLAGGIAHDFNNILTAVLGHLDLASLVSTDSAQVEVHLTEARNGAKRAAELTGQMLAYSGKGVFNLQRVDLNAIIRDVGALLGASISKKASLEYRLADALPPIKGDATQLRQVIMNLVINASEALSETGGVITLTTSAVHAARAQLAVNFAESDLPDGDYVLLEVSDTARGMDPATLAKALEPFFTTKFTGRGLGLAVVAGIVRGHHGAITIDSTPELGTTFRVALQADMTPLATADTVDEVPTIAERGEGVILVVDDEPGVRTIAAKFLEHAGYSVVSAAGGAEGLEIFGKRSAEISAVLLDVTMPGISTEDILAELNAIRSDVVIVLCSGYSEEEISARFADKDVCAFIAKPFTLAGLTKMMSRCLAASR